VSRPELRARVHEVTKGSCECGAEWLRGFRASELPMRADVLVRVLYALLEDLVMRRILTPELYPDEVFLRGLRGGGTERRNR